MFNPFVLRTVNPCIEDFDGLQVFDISRLGKRIVMSVSGGYFAVIHVMIAGRFGQPCPNCGSPVQRIRYVKNESNYCPRCQTGGRVLADRPLLRLLTKDWPRTLDELEHRKI